VSHVYCGECGFQKPEAANYCSRCGARLEKGESGEQTMTFTPDEMADEAGAAIGDVVGKGSALVVRAGGGRAGESFFPSGERTLIGRSPECDIFLDDVTVSRKHAELVRDGDTFTISDLGSLNGTFVNRKRIETAQLEDDDEVQIGKYRLTFLRR
jgi:pSer/pThr/pTyr-binding forkhead associated (FHA) protein